MGCYCDVDHASGSWQQCWCGAYACSRCADGGCPRCKATTWREARQSGHNSGSDASDPLNYDMTEFETIGHDSGEQDDGDQAAHE